METDDQNGQDPDDEILHKMHTEEITESIAMQVLSVRTEESILQEATKEIEDIAKANFQSEEGIKRLMGIQNNESGTKNCIEQVELEKQVQTGEITPFQAVTKHSSSQRIKGTFDKTSHLLDLEKYLKQQAELANQKKRLKKDTKTLHNEETVLIPTKKTKLSSCSLKTNKKSNKAKPKGDKKKSVSNIAKHGNVDYDDCTTKCTKFDQVDESTNDNKNLKNISTFINISKDNTGDNLITSSNNADSMNLLNDSDSEYMPSDEQIDSEDETKVSSRKRKVCTKSVCTRTKRFLDDGNELMYRQRVEESKLAKNEPVHKIDNLFKIPQSIWKKLFKYQKVSVQWLWELHGRNLGGLLGDEMGLGKTVQVIAFLAGLDCSELLSDGGRFRGLGPTIVVCPATLMEQWLKHFHEWWPILRIVVLHQSGTYSGDLEYLINSLKVGGILITSYSGMLRHKDLLIGIQWHYIILDEGHKIRNPQAKVSKAVKEFSTPHRLLLTGSPMQNSLKELWSLFDFILPGKLGTLPAFLEHCASPITRGGYANATPLQEATALHVATMLKDAITPYMLRRTKNDVQHHVSLPEKNEQVLFCSLTEEQKNLYKNYLRSEDVSFILHEKNNHHESGRYRARLLISLSALRKICNHPDLYLYTSQIDSDEETDMSEDCLKKFGHWKRAGKMTVVRSLLKIWKKQGHRALIFTQGRQMMHILESLVQSEKYTYLRMDGTTPMSQRQETIRLFNDNPTYFVFLLTTRVGGLGVNLTGANRVVIYDPDWNPATDAQARERAWRIGQNKNVTIYRLITAGTIEEKIYHRQIFKVLLSNKVLEDPRQRRLFKTSDLAELFNLNEPTDGKSSESDRLFRDSKLSVTTQFSSSKVEKMRKLAATLSKTISQNVSTAAPSTQSACNSDKTTVCNHANNEDSRILTVKETRTLEHNNKYSSITSSKETIKSSSSEENTEKEQQSLDRNENIFSSETQKDMSGDGVINNEISHNIEISLSNEVSDINNVLRNENNIESKTSNELEDINNTTEIIKSSKKENTIYDPCNTHQKHKKSKKSSRLEKKISAIFEGEHISCLIGRRLGHSQLDEPNPAEDDHYVLKKLFAKASVSSAFQHDAVLSNRGYNPDDKNPMQRLARETALESMDSVRKSRKWCWKPTWDSASPKNDDL